MSYVYALAGIVRRFHFVGMTGVGGGSLMTPILLHFGIAPVNAVGTDLLYAAITKANGVFVHQKKKNVDWSITMRLACGGIPAAVLTLIAFRLLQSTAPPKPQCPHYLFPGHRAVDHFRCHPLQTAPAQLEPSQRRVSDPHDRICSGMLATVIIGFVFGDHRLHYFHRRRGLGNHGLVPGIPAAATTSSWSAPKSPTRFP